MLHIDKVKWLQTPVKSLVAVINNFARSPLVFPALVVMVLSCLSPMFAIEPTWTRNSEDAEFWCEKSCGLLTVYKRLCAAKMCNILTQRNPKNSMTSPHVIRTGIRQVFKELTILWNLNQYSMYSLSLSANQCWVYRFISCWRGGYYHCYVVRVL